MSMLIVSHEADGRTNVSISGTADLCDMVCLCFNDYQRQPFLLRTFDGISVEDVSTAFYKSRGREISFLPVNSANSVSFEVGAADQARLVREGLRPFSANNRNLLVVAFERPDGEIVPFTNMLPHQWYDYSEMNYHERVPDDAKRFHFYLCSSFDSIDATRQDFEPFRSEMLCA